MYMQDSQLYMGFMLKHAFQASRPGKQNKERNKTLKAKKGKKQDTESKRGKKLTFMRRLKRIEQS